MARYTTFSAVTIADNAIYTSGALDIKNSYFGFALAKGTMAANLTGNPTILVHFLYSYDGTNYTDLTDNIEAPSIIGKIGLKTGATAVFGRSLAMQYMLRPNASGAYVKFAFENKTGQSFTGDLTVVYNIDIA